MNFNNSNIIYINLDKRKDRKKYIEDQLDSCNIQGIRFSGIDASTFNSIEKKYWLDPDNFKNRLRKPDPKRTLGKVGCMLSHLKTLKYAIDHKYNNVLILEDDSYFLLKDPTTMISKIPKDANVIFLCYLIVEKYAKDIIPTLKPGLIKINNFGTVLCNAYYFPTLSAMKKVYKELINQPKNAIDLMYYRHIQSKFPCYIVYPPPILQSNDFVSDVTYFGKKNKKVSWNRKYIKYFQDFWS